MVFATSEGENVQAAAVPVAVALAGWWSIGPLLALTWARPAPIAGAAWVAGLAVSFVALHRLYDSTSSTSAIGLLTIPVGVAGASAVAVLVSWATTMHNAR